jgi:hypothetical protein
MSLLTVCLPSVGVHPDALLCCSGDGCPGRGDPCGGGACASSHVCSVRLPAPNAEDGGDAKTALRWVQVRAKKRTRVRDLRQAPAAQATPRVTNAYIINGGGD